MTIVISDVHSNLEAPVTSIVEQLVEVRQSGLPATARLGR
jgi:hypothetical protein